MKISTQLYSVFVLVLFTFTILSLCNSLSIFDKNCFQTEGYLQQTIFLKSIAITLFFLLALIVVGHTFYPRTKHVIITLFVLSVTCATAYNYSSVTYHVGSDTIRRNGSSRSIMFSLQDIFRDKVVIQYQNKLFGEQNFGLVRPSKVIDRRESPQNTLEAIKQLTNTSDYRETAMWYDGKRYILGFSEKLCSHAKTIHLLSGIEKENTISLFITPQNLINELPNTNEFNLNELFNGKIVYIQKGRKFSSKIETALAYAEKIISITDHQHLSNKSSGEEIHFMIPGDKQEGIRYAIFSCTQKDLDSKEVYLRTDGSSSIARINLQYPSKEQLNNVN